MSSNESPTGSGVTRPDPVYTADAAFFWEGVARGELLGQRCADCSRLVHPPRPMCPSCHSLKRETVRLSGRGKVYSWVIPRHPAPLGFAESPIVALIELEEGIRLVSNVIEVSAEKRARWAGGGGVFRAHPRRARGPGVPPAEVMRVAKFAAIAGIGQTEFSKNSGRSELQLAAEASKAALDDAGIDPADVDGMITFTLDPSDEIGLSPLSGREGSCLHDAHPGRRGGLGRDDLPGDGRGHLGHRAKWCSSGAP